jgi:hypothetical protein
MSWVDIRAGLEARLATVPGALVPTKRENKKFDPVQGQPYWAISIDKAPIQHPAAGQGFRRYRGVFLIVLAWPFDSGTGPAEALGDAIAAHFARGLSTTANQVRTVFDRDPDVKPGRVVGDRWEVPIGVNFYADVQG